MTHHHHFPGCGHGLNTPPPPPPPNTSGQPNASIGMYTSFLLIIAIIIIKFYKKL